jgi:hypothetical protein
MKAIDERWPRTQKAVPVWRDNGTANLYVCVQLDLNGISFPQDTERGTIEAAPRRGTVVINFS